MKIYKSFEEFWSSIPYPKLVRPTSRLAWNARQAEIDQLKEALESERSKTKKLLSEINFFHRKY